MIFIAYFAVILFYLFFFIFSVYFIYAFILGAPFVPTTKKHVKEMLELTNLKDSDILMDLGSGDGRFFKI
ncbi:MAG: hypothetical protein WA057_04040, partial [Candidatus Magasanikiibacteriota bacterium]